MIIVTGPAYDKATPETLIHLHYHSQASYSLPHGFHLLQQAGCVCVYKQVAVMASGTTMPRFGAIELFWPRGSACVRYSENYLTQEVDERESVSMLSGCATRGFFSVLATIRLKLTPFPLLLTQYVPPLPVKLAQLDVNR